MVVTGEAQPCSNRCQKGALWRVVHRIGKKKNSKAVNSNRDHIFEAWQTFWLLAIDTMINNEDEFSFIASPAQSRTPHHLAPVVPHCATVQPQKRYLLLAFTIDSLQIS